MGARVEVVELVPDEWRRWRALRLAALEQDPAAFGSTLADWTGDGDTEERWRSRWQGVPHNLVATLGGADVGIVGLAVPGAGAAPELLSMWVAPWVRGHGVGDALVAAVVGLAAALRPGEPLTLSVVEGNAAARRLYVRHGFVVAGSSPDDPGELMMVRPA